MINTILPFGEVAIGKMELLAALDILIWADGLLIPFKGKGIIDSLSTADREALGYLSLLLLVKSASERAAI
ncbi:hypothetical protein NIES4071_08370 [Calothrix sp. NIES-4071]|nr:hypothetical protein NIES4071_08370 [Calothrix sp. NIES-4071]BAZ55179.1 hypothetical protein NIES4105_08330 [Calothrix sp. NIES-4105]